MAMSLYSYCSDTWCQRSSVNKQSVQIKSCWSPCCSGVKRFKSVVQKYLAILLWFSCQRTAFHEMLLFRVIASSKFSRLPAASSAGATAALLPCSAGMCYNLGCHIKLPLCSESCSDVWEVADIRKFLFVQQFGEERRGHRSPYSEVLEVLVQTQRLALKSKFYLENSYCWDF